MKKIISLFSLVILFSMMISCLSDQDDSFKSNVPLEISNVENIPLKYHGIWKIKYKDNVDISIPGSHFTLTSETVALKTKIYTYNNNNQVSDISYREFEFYAQYQVKPTEQIFNSINGVKLEIHPSQHHTDYLEFILHEYDKDPVIYTVQKQ